MGEVVRIGALREMRETRFRREHSGKAQGTRPVVEEYIWVPTYQFELQVLSDASIDRSNLDIVREVGFYLGRGGRLNEIVDYAKGKKNLEEQEEAINGYATAIAFSSGMNSMAGRMDKARRERIKMNTVVSLRRALIEPVLNST